jgi:hypothetical protein
MKKAIYILKFVLALIIFTSSVNGVQGQYEVYTPPALADSSSPILGIRAIGDTSGNYLVRLDTLREFRLNPAFELIGNRLYVIDCLGFPSGTNYVNFYVYEISSLGLKAKFEYRRTISLRKSYYNLLDFRFEDYELIATMGRTGLGGLQISMHYPIDYYAPENFHSLMKLLIRQARQKVPKSMNNKSMRDGFDEL